MSTNRRMLPDPPANPTANAGFGDQYLRDLSAKLDADGYAGPRGTYAQLLGLSPGSPPRTFHAIDTGQFFIDGGTAWIELQTPPRIGRYVSNNGGDSVSSTGTSASLVSLTGRGRAFTVTLQGSIQSDVGGGVAIVLLLMDGAEINRRRLGLSGTDEAEFHLSRVLSPEEIGTGARTFGLTYISEGSQNMRLINSAGRRYRLEVIES